MKEKLDFIDVLKIINKRKIIVISILSIFIIITAIFNFYIIEPTYEADTTIIVSKSEANTDDTISSEELSVTKNLAITYANIIKSRTVLEKVISSMNLEYNYEELYSSINIQSIEDTQIIKISVQNKSAEVAMNIANSIPDIFKSEVKRLTNTNKVEIIDKAILSTKPVRPRKVINVSIAFIIGFLISITFAFILDYLDSKIKNKSDVENYLGLPIIGSIAMDKMLKKEVTNTLISNEGPILESYRSIRNNIEFFNIDKTIKVIMVTSSQPGEGKSTFISNISKVFATLDDKKILLIDCDFRRPKIHKIFKINNTQGLTDILVKNIHISECIKNISGLNIISAGTKPINPSDILASKKMIHFIQQIRSEYDYIFIDSPPVNIVSDAEVLSRIVDGVIVIIGCNEVERNSVKQCKEKLNNLNANILGCIVNKENIKKGNYYY